MKVKRKWIVVHEAPEMAELTRAWESAFGPGVEPQKEALLAATCARTTRFHTIPSGSEYARSRDDLAVLVDRNNAILHALGSDQTLLAVSCHGEEADFYEPYRRSWALQRGLRHWKTLKPVITDDDVAVEVFVDHVRLPSGELDQLLRDIAEERRDVVAIAPTTFDWAVAPYTGGVDVVARSASEMQELRDRFIEWLPSAWQRDVERVAWRFVDSLDALDAHFQAAVDKRLPQALGALLTAVNRGESAPDGVWHGVEYRKHGYGAELILGEHHVDIDVDRAGRHAAVVVDPWKVALTGPRAGVRVDAADVPAVLREAARQGRLEVEGDRFLWRHLAGHR
jgi:hypothetical protein